MRKERKEERKKGALLLYMCYLNQRTVSPTNKLKASAHTIDVHSVKMTRRVSKHLELYIMCN